MHFLGFTRPIKSMSFQEVFESKEISNKTAEKTTKTTPTAFRSTQCNMKLRVHGIGSNENNLYLHKVLNKKVLDDFAMVKKKAFYITPPFEAHSKVTPHSTIAYKDDAKDIKKQLLAQFTMKRKEAFYVTPPFEYEIQTPAPERDQADEYSDTGPEKENNEDQEPIIDKHENPTSVEDKHENLKYIFDMQENPRSTKDKQRNLTSVLDDVDLRKSMPVANDTLKSNNTDAKAAQSYDYDITFNPTPFVTPYILRNKENDDYRKTITELTEKQEELTRKLKDVVGDEAKLKKYNAEFKALMKAIEVQKAWASSTVMIMLDETDVRNKLRKDPFVQRILKMAQKRKEEYFRKAAAEAAKDQPLS